MENMLRHILGRTSFPQMKSQVPPAEVVPEVVPVQQELPLEIPPEPNPQ